MIPAIDIARGRLARVTSSDAQLVEAFGGDPARAAAAFVQAGAPWLHVVDVDLARSGRPENLDVVRAISELGVPVQASGGVLSDQHVEAMLGAGARRVVLGSGVLADRSATERLVRDRGDAVVVAIEADGPTIVPRGGEGSPLLLWDTLVWLAGLPIHRFVFVEVGRVGSLEGPDLDGVWALAQHVRRPVLASGGVRSLDDLRALARLGGDVEGAIVGRALHEGGLDLAEAIAAVS